MINVLWVTAGLNHYKARFLDHLAAQDNLSLTLLTGTGRKNMGDQELQLDWSFRHIKVDVPKKDFGSSKLVKEQLKTVFNQYDWVLIPAEKKNLPLFIYTLKIKKHHKQVKLFSYNHPVFKSGKGKVTLIDKWLTKWFYRKLDRVIFYTEHSCEWAVENKLIKPEKAFWANNTVDTSEITKHYSFHLPPKDSVTLLFIGRLIPSKRIPDLLKYYHSLKERIPNLKLDVIGDGPERHLIKSTEASDADITCFGTLINEEDIAPLMTKASLVFIPGHSGLSVNHAFAYGRAYVTLQGPSHAPELGYLTHGENGYLLEDDFQTNVETLFKLLSNREELERFSMNAKAKGDYLSVEKWVEQMHQCLTHD